jgi:hypothetical protein
VERDEAKAHSIGPIGPIPVVPEDDPGLKARREAYRLAQSAIECVDLIELVLHHPNPVVRMEAVARLNARYPKEPAAHDALIHAVGDADEGVRCEAISAVADLALPGAGDLLAAALSDPEPDVRFFAAIGLQALDDPRTPTDPESFAYR